MITVALCGEGDHRELPWCAVPEGSAFVDLPTDMSAAARFDCSHHAQAEAAMRLLQVRAAAS